MSRLILASSRIASLIAILLCAAFSFAQIPATFMGLNVNQALPLYPAKSVTFATTRLWDTGTTWGEINTASGTYNWSVVDSWLSQIQTHGGLQVIYTFGGTPQWASSKGSDTTCAYNPGSCDPPKDLNADGTGADLYWQTFVKAIVNHVGTRVQYWEMWDTPQDPTQWRGTYAQLVRMTKDARAIIKAFNPNAKILTPPFGSYHVPLSSYCYVANKLAPFFQAGGGAYVDYISFHGYIGTGTPVPENVVPVITCLKSTLKQYGQTGKQIWDTEGSWGQQVDLSNADQQAAFVARSYLIQLSQGISRYLWYSWDNKTWGTLYNSGTATILKPGKAYLQVYKWLVGATLASPCGQANNGTWSCGLTRSNGYHALALWNTKASTNYIVPSGYSQYRDLAGVITKVSSGHAITLTYKPILLEN